MERNKNLGKLAGIALGASALLSSGCVIFVPTETRHPPIVVIYGRSHCHPPRRPVQRYHGPAFTNPTANQGYFYGSPHYRGRPCRR